MKRTLYLALFLAVVAGLAGGLLTLVDSVTRDKITEAEISKELVYLEVIFPGGTFTKETEKLEGAAGLLDLYTVEGKGTVYKVEETGFGGTIVYLVGFDTDQKIVGTSVISHTETPGFGDVIETDTFSSANSGKKATDQLYISSGATVSSKAVNRGILAAASHLSGGELVAEPEQPTLGDKVSLSDEKLSKYPATIESTEEDGDNVVYRVKAEGYGLVASEYPSPDYKENLFVITINKETRSIVSIELEEFGDTKNIGDVIDNPLYFELFVGVNSLDAEVDTYSNATITSYSLFSAINAVLADQ